jgi:hypothetical protein
MARKPKNPINDIVDTVGAWLGGNRGSMPSSGAGAAWQASARSAAQSGNTNLVKGLGEVPVQLGALGMGTSAQVQRDVMYGVPGAGTQAAKEAAVSYVTGAAAGYGVGKVATKVAGRVVESGVPARVVNKVTGQKVVVHGSPVSRLTKIEPRVGSNQLPESSVMFGWDPSKKGMQNQITRQAGKYTSKNQGSQVGSLYVTSIKKSDVVTPDKLLNTGQVVSKGSGQVLKEIPASGKGFREIDAELQRQLRRFGAPAKPQVSRVAAVVSKTKTKVSDIVLTKAKKQELRNRRIR